MTLDCDFADGQKGSRCERCGYQLRFNCKTTPKRNCTGPPGWGDRLASFFRVTRLACLAPRNCGCPLRQRKINRFGWRAKEVIARLLKFLTLRTRERQ